MKLRQNRVTERAGVNAARAFFESHEQIFQEVELGNDYGKDAYVDFTQDKVVLGLCAGFQIKSGKTYRLASGYTIPVEGHLEVWRNSSVPMIGIVHDDRDGGLYWVNITSFLAKTGGGSPASIPVRSGNKLTATSLNLELLPAVRESRRVDELGTAMRQLCAGEPLIQAAAIRDCFALGRGDARVMLAMRNCLRSFSGIAVKQAIVVLSHFVSHPDIVWNDRNWASEQVRSEVRGDFIWTDEELVKLFAATKWGEGWTRGSLGQCLYYLLVVDPDHKAKVERVIPRLVSLDLDAAFAAMYLTLVWATKPRKKLDQIVKKYPNLGAHDLTGEVVGALDEFGYAAWEC